MCQVPSGLDQTVDKVIAIIIYYNLEIILYMSYMLFERGIVNRQVLS